MHILNFRSARNTDLNIRFQNGKPVHEAIVVHAQITSAVEGNILRISAVHQEQIGQVAVGFRSAHHEIIHRAVDIETETVEDLRGRQDAASFNRYQTVSAEAQFRVFHVAAV